MRVIAPFVIVGSLLSIGVTGQGTQPAPANHPVAMTADGHPDIQGYWRGAGNAGGAAYDLERGMPDDERVLTSRPAGQAADVQVIVDPPDGKIPYLPWAAKLRDELREKALHPRGPEDLDSGTRCFQVGVPRHAFAGGGDFQVLQSPTYVVILYDRGSSRYIALDGRAHISAKIKLWMGDSVGHWEGNTLVVDVANNNEYPWYDVYGNFHSAELRVIERWTILDAGTIRYEATSYDPQVFSKPWTLRNEFRRITDKSYELWENSCYEGERSVDLILSGSAAEKK